MAAGTILAIGGKKYGQMKDSLRLGSEVIVSFQTSPAIPEDSSLKGYEVFCSLDKMMETFQIFSFFSVQDSFNKNIMWMRDAGIIQKMESDSMRKGKDTQFSKVSGLEPFRILRLALQSKCTYRVNFYEKSSS